MGETSKRSLKIAEDGIVSLRIKVEALIDGTGHVSFDALLTGPPMTFPNQPKQSSDSILGYMCHVGGSPHPLPQGHYEGSGLSCCQEGVCVQCGTEPDGKAPCANGWNLYEEPNLIPVMQPLVADV